MMNVRVASIAPFSGRGIDSWLTDYRVALSGRDEATIDAYLRTIRQFALWFAERPGNNGAFYPQGAGAQS